MRPLTILVLMPWRPWLAMITTPLFVILGMSVNLTLELLLPVNGVSGATSRGTAPLALLALDVRCSWLLLARLRLLPAAAGMFAGKLARLAGAIARLGVAALMKVFLKYRCWS